MNDCTNAADDDCDESGDMTNPPLVSPQSTLIDLPLALPPGLPIPNEPLKLSDIQEENPEKPVEYNHNASEASVLPVCLQSNPFLQDVYQTSTTADRVAIQLVITMWRSNLELQIPILKAYNGHLARMSSRTRIVPRKMITRVEEATNHLISTLNELTRVVNNVDNVISDTSPLSTDESTSYSVASSLNALGAPLNVSPSNEFYTFPQTPVDKCHRGPPDFISNDRVNRNIFDDTEQIERSFSNRDSNLHSTVLLHSDKSNNGTMCFNDNDLGLSDIVDRVQALTVNANLLEVNNISDAIDFSESVESTPVRKETNPFKMNIFDNENLLLNEAQRKTVQAPIASPKKSRNMYKSNLSENQEKIAPNLTHTPRYELFADKHELGLNNNKPSAKLRPSGIFPLDNKSNARRRNLFDAVEERTDHNPTVSCSYFTYDKETSSPEVQHSTNNNTVTEPSPFTLPTYLSMIDNPNLDDEGYLTRPSTSDTLESSSPFGLTSEVDCFDQTSGAALEQSSSISAEAWIKSIENTIVLNSLPSKHPDDTLASSNNTKCLNSVNTNSTFDDTNNSIKLTNFGEKSKTNNLIIPMNIVEKVNDENEQKNLDDSSSKELIKRSNTNTENISPASSCIKPLYFHVVELTQGSVHVFHFEESGWISVEEFTEYFTPFGNFSFMLNMTHILDDEISLREINRSCHPSMFEELDRSSLIAWRDSENKIYKISMISLQSGLKVLVKFKIIASTDWSLWKDKKGLILHDIYTLLSTYNNFKRRVDGGAK